MPLGDLREHVRQLFLDELKLRDGLVELDSSFCVIDCPFVTRHGRADPSPGNSIACLIQAHERRAKTVAFRQEIRFRHKHVVEDQIGGHRSSQRKLVLDFGSLESRRLRFHDEAFDRVVGLGPDNGDIGNRSTRDPPFRPVEDPPFVRAARARFHAARV